MSFIATQRLFTPSPSVHDAFTVSPSDLSFHTLTFVCHSLPNCLSPLLLSSHKHGPLTPCRPIPILFKLGQSQECTLHTPHHSLAISKSSISIPLGSAPYYSFFHHHHNHNSFKQTVKSKQSIRSLQIYLPPPPTNQSTWVPPPSPVKASRPPRATSTARDVRLCK